MHDFVIPVAIGASVALGWLLLWTVVLRALGIKLPGPPLDKEVDRQRALEMGKFRYVMIYGVMGWGFAIGLGLGLGMEYGRHPFHWASFGFLFAVMTLGNGVFRGLSSWSKLFQEPVPFPPPLPPLK